MRNRSLLRVVRISASMSLLVGFISAAIWYSTSASSSLPTAAETTAAFEVLLRGAELGPLQRQPGRPSSGSWRPPSVLDDRQVVVLQPLGLARPAHGAGGGAAGRQCRHDEQQRRRAHDASDDEVSDPHR